MSELSEAINEMRNMRESYDQIGAAAEAYNVGKTQLAAAITAKGVETQPTETYPEMAEKVNAISQETFEINGGEMYAKQLFGSLETPNYWNLYDIMAQLLSDGRLVNYGGILLAEYYKGNDSLALSGAGAGGAYVVSDKDSDGNFIMYTNDTTHTWATEEDGKGNRWVAYCFANAGHSFEITDTNTSPRTIVIGRSVGSINLLASSRTSEVIVFPGSTLVRYNSNGEQSNWNPRTVVKQTGNAVGMFVNSNKITSLYLETGTFNGGRLFTPSSDSTLACIIFKSNSIVSSDRETAFFPRLSTYSALSNIIICGVNSCNGIMSFSNWNGEIAENINLTALKSVSILDSEQITLSVNFSSINQVPNFKTIYFGYSTNDRTKSFVLYSFANRPAQNNVNDVVLQDGWKKPMNVAVLGNLTEANIVNHILNKLGDNSGQPAITITLGATNLAKLTAEEKAIATNKGFTLA